MTMTMTRADRTDLGEVQENAAVIGDHTDFVGTRGTEMVTGARGVRRPAAFVQHCGLNSSRTPSPLKKHLTPRGGASEFC